jgi:hypothetical protein
MRPLSRRANLCKQHVAFPLPLQVPAQADLLTCHAGLTMYSRSCTGWPTRARGALGGRPVCGWNVQSRSSSSSFACRSCGETPHDCSVTYRGWDTVHSGHGRLKSLDHMMPTRRGPPPCSRTIRSPPRLSTAHARGGHACRGHCWPRSRSYLLVALFNAVGARPAQLLQAPLPAGSRT